MIPVTSKVLEKVISISNNRLLHQNQFAFRPQSRTDDTLFALTEQISIFLDHKRHLLVVSLDIKVAFDNVWWPAILRNLKQYNCPKYVYTHKESHDWLLYSFLLKRSVHACNNSNIKKHRY